MTQLLVASHNIMDGLRLAELLPAYRQLRGHGLALLCLQEDRRLAGAMPGDQVRAALGPRFALSRDTAAGSGLTLLYDRDQVELAAATLLPLPQLGRLSWLERRYIRGGQPEQKHALLVELTAGGRPLAVANFHLDTAGDNRHRRAQVALLAGRLGSHPAFIACGDTNAFSLGRGDAVARVSEPLARLGAVDPERRPTHFFARQGEPSLPHRLAALLARNLVDLPRRYDIICTTLPVVSRGQMVTPASDHDLVWLRIAL